MSGRANAPPKPWVYVALPGQEIEYFQMQQEEPPPKKAAPLLRWGSTGKALEPLLWRRIARIYRLLKSLAIL